jgi:hypothetical protein
MLHWVGRAHCGPSRAAPSLASQCTFLAIPAAVHDTAFGEFVPLSDKAGVPVLVRLRERPWGALARLPASKLAEAGYAGGLLGAGLDRCYRMCGWGRDPSQKASGDGRHTACRWLGHR